MSLLHLFLLTYPAPMHYVSYLFILSLCVFTYTTCPCPHLPISACLCLCLPASACVCLPLPDSAQPCSPPPTSTCLCLPSPGYMPPPVSAHLCLPPPTSAHLYPPLPTSTHCCPPPPASAVTAQLACRPENHGGMYGNPMMGSGGLPEGRLGEVGLRMEAGKPLEGRPNGNEEVSIVHGCSRQDLDYPACWPVPQSIWVPCQWWCAWISWRWRRGGAVKRPQNVLNQHCYWYYSQLQG